MEGCTLSQLGLKQLKHLYRGALPEAWPRRPGLQQLVVQTHSTLQRGSPLHCQGCLPHAQPPCLPHLSHPTPAQPSNCVVLMSIPSVLRNSTDPFMHNLSIPCQEVLAVLTSMCPGSEACHCLYWDLPGAERRLAHNPRDCPAQPQHLGAAGALSQRERLSEEVRADVAASFWACK